MGNLFSLKLDAPPPLRPPSHHKRKQRGPSVTSANGAGIPTTFTKGHKNSIRVSASCDASALGQPTVAPVANQKPRRSSLKMTLKRAYSSASASSNVLTDERRHLVQATWKEITDKTGKLQASVSIFRHLFQACPDLKRVFNVDTLALHELETSDQFVRHARVFANVLDLAVRNVFDLEQEVGPILIMFGRRHFYKHQLGFRNEYLTLFAQSMSDFISANLSETFANNTEATPAWKLFISYIIHKVKEGYDLECIQARKHSAMLY